jgi:hypothetical protein
VKILVANGWIGGRSGSEVHTKDLAMGLSRRGHQCTIFVGQIKQVDADVRELRQAGVTVTERPEATDIPDIIIGHHLRETTLACLRYPKTPAIQICHDATHDRDRAAGPEIVQAWGAVDAFCQERFARETGLRPEEISLIFNPVDLSQFPPRQMLPLTPPRRAALFFSCASTPSILATIRQACERQGIALEVIGPGARFEEEPGRVLSSYDLVFGKARCAIEAMASGAHVILCAPEGIGPPITINDFHALRRRNFGRSVLAEPMGVELLERRILGLKSGVTTELTRLIRQHSNTERLAEHMESILRPLASLEVDRSVFRIRLRETGQRIAAYGRRKFGKLFGPRSGA